MKSEKRRLKRSGVAHGATDWKWAAAPTITNWFLQDQRWRTMCAKQKRGVEDVAAYKGSPFGRAVEPKGETERASAKPSPSAAPPPLPKGEARGAQNQNRDGGGGRTANINHSFLLAC